MRLKHTRLSQLMGILGTDYMLHWVVKDIVLQLKRPASKNKTSNLIIRSFFLHRLFEDLELFAYIDDLCSLAAQAPYRKGCWYCAVMAPNVNRKLWTAAHVVAVHSQRISSYIWTVFFSRGEKWQVLWKVHVATEPLRFTLLSECLKIPLAS